MREYELGKSRIKSVLLSSDFIQDLRKMTRIVKRSSNLERNEKFEEYRRVQLNEHKNPTIINLLAICIDETGGQNTFRWGDDVETDTHVHFNSIYLELQNWDLRSRKED